MCDLHSVPKINQEDLKKTVKRSKLWELDLHWHCAIVGTCLTQTELNKLGQKCKAPKYTGRIADYKLHSFMVGQARHGQGIGRVLHKFIERKYTRAVKQFSGAKTSEEVEKLWAQSFEKGDIPGPFWAVMTHEACSMDLQAQVYGEVHMLSHLEGASNRADHREIADLKTAAGKLQNELIDVRKNSGKAIDKRDALIGELKAKLKIAEEKAARSDELEAMLLAERDGESISRLENRIECLTARVLQETDRADITQTRLIEMEYKKKDFEKAVQAKELRIVDLECELLSLETSICEQGAASCMKDQGCPGDEDLCGRCIAYIGGQTKQAAFFRDFVEKKNGQFVHHDGGLHDGQARLLSILAQADAVMFPVTCISHEATREIKRVCMQQQKPFVPLRSQGMGAFTRGLETLDEDKFQKPS